MRISIDDEFGTFAQAEVRPGTFKDMGKWKEVDDTVLFGNRHAFVVCLQSSIIRAVPLEYSLHRQLTIPRVVRSAFIYFIFLL
jgi:hypothetical protein